MDDRVDVLEMVAHGLSPRSSVPLQTALNEKLAPVEWTAMDLEMQRSERVRLYDYLVIDLGELGRPAFFA